LAAGFSLRQTELVHSLERLIQDIGSGVASVTQLDDLSNPPLAANAAHFGSASQTV
jgi:hypothetical protein